MPRNKFVFENYDIVGPFVIRKISNSLIIIFDIRTDKTMIKPIEIRGINYGRLGCFDGDNLYLYDKKEKRIVVAEIDKINEIDNINMEMIPDNVYYQELEHLLEMRYFDSNEPLMPGFDYSD